jgi:opacity protein-like surface antigen
LLLAGAAQSRIDGFRLQLSPSYRMAILQNGTFSCVRSGVSPNGAAPAGTVETKIAARIGWTAGAGVEVPIAAGWTGRLEYLYAQFGDSRVTFPLSAQHVGRNKRSALRRIDEKAKRCLRRGLLWRALRRSGAMRCAYFYCIG